MPGRTPPPPPNERPALRAVLIGCSGSKLPGRAPAKHFYTSDLFRKRRTYAERSGCPWFIFSASYGLVLPDQELEPYDTTFSDSRYKNWRAILSGRIADSLRLRGFTNLEIHAGADYTVDLTFELRRVRIAFTIPCAGLGIGQQLGWYKVRADAAHQEALASAQLSLFSEETELAGISDDRPPIPPHVQLWMSVMAAEAKTATDLAEWAANEFELYEPDVAAWGSDVRPLEQLFELAAELLPTN